MKIPKYIDKALKTRTALAYRLDIACSVVDDWLDKNNIECETCDTHTGVKIYCNPSAIEKRIREAIKNTGGDEYDD